MACLKADMYYHGLNSLLCVGILAQGPISFSFV